MVIICTTFGDMIPVENGSNYHALELWNLLPYLEVEPRNLSEQIHSGSKQKDKHRVIIREVFLVVYFVCPISDS